LKKISEKSKFDQNQPRTSTLYEGLYTFMTVSHQIIFSMRNILDKPCRENETHISCAINLLRKSCRLWDSVGKI